MKDYYQRNLLKQQKAREYARDLRELCRQLGLCLNCKGFSATIRCKPCRTKYRGNPSKTPRFLVSFYPKHLTVQCSVCLAAKGSKCTNLSGEVIERLTHRKRMLNAKQVIR